MVATLVAGRRRRHGNDAPRARRHSAGHVAQPLLNSGLMRRLNRLRGGLDFGLAFALGVMVAMFT